MARFGALAGFISILFLVLVLSPPAAALSPTPFWYLPETCISLIVFRVVLCFLVAGDARKRKESPTGWVVLVLLFGVLALLVYAFTRVSPPAREPPPAPGGRPGARYTGFEPAYPPPAGAGLPLPEGFCPSCNAVIQRGLDRCPRCGERRR